MTTPATDMPTFSIDEANNMLPLVKRIVADIVTVAGRLTEQNDRLTILQGYDADEGDPRSEEVEQLQKSLEQDMDRLQEYVDELQGLGAELKSATQGLVDFRTTMDGRDAYLCWKLGEDEIAHWHGLDEDETSRQSLFEDAASDN